MITFHSPTLIKIPPGGLLARHCIITHRLILNFCHFYNSHHSDFLVGGTVGGNLEERDVTWTGSLRCRLDPPHDPMLLAM
jgi:hypothetical protein